MTTTRPAALGGLRHVALYVENFEACEHFCVDLLGMAAEWRPDSNNLYLSSGCDNLALHSTQSGVEKGAQKLDHIGFIVDDIAAVDAWFDYLRPTV